MAKKPVKMIVGPSPDADDKKPAPKGKARPGKTLGGKARYMRGLK